LSSETRPDSPALRRAALTCLPLRSAAKPGFELGCLWEARALSRQPKAPGGAGNTAIKAAPAHAAQSCLTVRAATRTSFSQSDSWASAGGPAAAGARTLLAKSSCSTPPIRDGCSSVAGAHSARPHHAPGGAAAGRPAGPRARAVQRGGPQPLSRSSAAHLSGRGARPAAALGGRVQVDGVVSAGARAGHVRERHGGGGDALGRGRLVGHHGGGGAWRLGGGAVFLRTGGSACRRAAGAATGATRRRTRRPRAALPACRALGTCPWSGTAVALLRALRKVFPLEDVQS
jgi:hypothetical protein